AVTHYERTIKWYTPLSPVVQRAVERLWQLGTEAEAHGERSLALEAYQTLRSSLYAVQSFYIPYQSWIAKSEERIAPLLARARAGDEQGKARRGKEPAALPISSHLQWGPYLDWSILSELGFQGGLGRTLAQIGKVLVD